MKKLTFDAGVEEYRLPGGVLRFNPADPNVYIRFQQAVEQLEQLETQMAQQLEQGSDVLTVMGTADKTIKDRLDWVFGPGNDFDKLLGGVNLLAATGSGERVVSHLFAALEPVLVDGARRCAGQLTDQARGKAQARRQSQ